MSHRVFVRLAAFLLLVHTAAVAAAPRWSMQLQYGGKKVALTETEFAKLQPTEVEASDDSGSHRYRGVSVHDLLRLVNAPPGEKLRRPTLCLVVRVKGADGLVCAFALAEFEEGFTDRTIVLASEMDGRPLPPELGPWRVIAPRDTRAARWVRQVVSLEVISIENDAGTGDAAQPDRAAERANERVRFVPRK